MSFKFIEDSNLSLANANRLPPTTPPATNHTFHVFIKAKPQPGFTGCVVRVVEVTDDDNIKVVFFDPTSGTEMAGSHSIDLTDDDTVWRGLPSQIDRPSKPAVKYSCGLLFFTEDWLKNHVPTLFAKIAANPSLFIKWPFGESGMIQAKQALHELITALQAAGQDPSNILQFPKLSTLRLQHPELF